MTTLVEKFKAPNVRIKGFHKCTTVNNTTKQQVCKYCNSRMKHCFTRIVPLLPTLGMIQKEVDSYECSCCGVTVDDIENSREITLTPDIVKKINEMEAA